MPDITLNANCTSCDPQWIRTLPVTPVAGLYVHVPFCVRKCEYCDFYSLSIGASADMERYVDAVLTEAGWWSSYLRGQQCQIRTVFLGGGTPTVLPSHLMVRLLEGLRLHVPMAREVEWSVEANPATVDFEYCGQLMEHGVNRLSIGAQSFVAGELAALGRVHDPDAVRRTVRDAQRAGFRRCSLDLMYAIPHQTLDSWVYSLHEAIALSISHISCYCLALEEGTPLWRKARNGRLQQFAEPQQLRFMQATRQELHSLGLQAYEISNHAMEGEECRHNLMYWRGGNYIGLGPAAASHLAGRRWRNAPDLRAYLAGIPHQRVETEGYEILSLQQRAVELAMLMLRLREGIDRQQFYTILGVDPVAMFQGPINRLEELGMLKRTVSGIALTERGVYVADEVISELVREVD